MFPSLLNFRRLKFGKALEIPWLTTLDIKNIGHISKKTRGEQINLLGFFSKKYPRFIFCSNFYTCRIENKIIDSYENIGNKIN